MEPFITPASESERRWAAGLLAQSEPWVKLGLTCDQLLKTCLDEEYLIFIAHFEEEACGVLIMDPRGVAGSPYIKSIAVTDNHRSHGIGAKMVAFAEIYFHEKSKHMFLCVSSFNDRASIFYKKLGYIQVGEFCNYIIDGESEILMYKRIG
jgi:ribosomal-protein-alanine N-acetyltransferase